MQTQNRKGKGVLLEDLDNKLDLLLEGQDTLVGRVDGLERKLGEFKEEMDYKFEVVFEELHGIRGDLRDKIGKDEFKEALSSFR